MATVFSIRGPIGRGDLPGLCDRVCALLEHAGAGDALCDVEDVGPDAVTVDALARLQLAAQRRGCRVVLRGASPDLLALVELMGLANVLPDRPIPTRGGAVNRKLFVNIPVADLDRSVAFFRELGFEFDPRFTDETATCMLVGEDAYFMLLTQPTFRGFAVKDVPDPQAQTGVLLAITAESREEVDGFADRALELGATPAAEPQDLGFMVSRSFFDLDGHHWEILWMDPAALEAQAG